MIKENGGKLPSLDKLQQMWVDANKDLEISDYYKPSLERKMFRPPFIQFYECTNILIENVKIINSPFWTVNPAFCDNVTIHGVTINNPSASRPDLMVIQSSPTLIKQSEMRTFRQELGLIPSVFGPLGI